MEVVRENRDLDLWQKPLPKESPQTLRNTGRIEQVEAKQADFEQQFKYILAYLHSLQWTSRGPSTNIRSLSWRELADMPDVTLELEDGIQLWMQTATLHEAMQFTFDEFILPYHEKLSAVTKLFGELEEDFDDVARRITRCAVLEEELGVFEDALEDEETECLASCVSLIRDVLDYNYAEELTQTHLDILKKAIGLIYDKGLECNKEDYQNLHEEFLRSGLALLPTSRKAIEKYEPTKHNDGE